MPHVVIEYSSNIEQSVKMGNIAMRAHDLLIATGLFNTADIKTRTYATQDYLVGEQGPDGCFAHISVAIMEGRPLEKRQALSEALRDMLAEALPEEVSISVEVRELLKDVYRKRAPAA